MKKILISLTILSLLWLSFSNLRKQTDNSLRQSNDLPDTFQFEDEQPLENISTTYGYATKGEWLKCINNRTQNTCEEEQPYLAAYQQFTTYISENPVCVQYLKAFDSWKDDQTIVVPAFKLCFNSYDIHQIANSNSCFNSYYKDIFFTCANF